MSDKRFRVRGHQISMLACEAGESYPAIIWLERPGYNPIGISPNEIDDLIKALQKAKKHLEQVEK